MARANVERVRRSLPPLPRTTPHTLRRTYITLALEAGLPVPFVMAQVGHSDSRTTLQIYAKVLARRDRSDHGRVFDEPVGGAIPSASEEGHPDRYDPRVSPHLIHADALECASLGQYWDNYTKQMFMRIYHGHRTCDDSRTYDN